MSAHIAISSWIDPRHLAREAGLSYRAAFAAHPAHAVVVPDFLQAPIALRLARFLGDEAEFTPGHGLKSRYGFVSEDAWRAAPAADRMFRYGFLDHARGAALESPNFATFLAVHRAFEAPATRAFFEAICGARLGAVTLSARRMAPGDFLAEHTDDVNNRVISFVLYLTPAWRPGHGGELALDSSAAGGDGAGGTYAHIVAPRFNHLALFDARAWHRVAPLADTPDTPARVSFGGWFLEPAAS